MNALENFKHAETFANMALGEKLVATGYVILLGMGITFIALVLIWALTALMSKVIQSIEKKSEIKKINGKNSNGNKTNSEVIETTKQPQGTKSPQVEEAEALELVAVITAAVAAMMNTSVNNIHVSNIKRTSDHTPTWGKAGRSELMNTRA